MSPQTPAELAEEGKRLYGRGQYEQAAEVLSRAAEGYRAAGDGLNAAEVSNNRSVALLQAGRGDLDHSQSPLRSRGGGFISQVVSAVGQMETLVAEREVGNLLIA